MLIESRQHDHHHVEPHQEVLEDLYVSDVLATRSSALLSDRSSAGILHTIPEDLALEEWDDCDQQRNRSGEEQFAMAWAGVLRNDVLLTDIGEENVPSTVIETAGGLLELEPRMGWDTYSLTPEVQGLRFHVYDDRVHLQHHQQTDQEVDSDLASEDAAVTVWIFCCVFNAQVLSLPQAKLFVQDHMVGLTQTLREVDPAWLHGGYHACQNLFAPVLQQRMERLYQECLAPQTASVPQKMGRKKKSRPSMLCSEPDLVLSDKIIERNRRVVQGHSFCFEEDDFDQVRDFPRELENTDHAAQSEADIIVDYGKELLADLKHEPSLPEGPLPQDPLTPERNMSSIADDDDSALAPVAPPNNAQSKADEVVKVVCLVEEQIPFSPHHDLWNKSPETISKRDATSYELGGKMMAEDSEGDVDDISEKVMDLLKMPALNVALAAATDEDLTSSSLDGSDDDAAFIDSLATVSQQLAPQKQEVGNSRDREPPTVRNPVSTIQESPISVSALFAPGYDKAELEAFLKPPPELLKKTTLNDTAVEKDSGQRNCFFCSIFAPKQSALA